MILAMDDEVYGEGDFVAADEARQFNLVRVSFCSSDPVGRGFARILKAQLDVIESGIDQRLQPRFGKANAGSDEVGVEAGGARCGDEFGKIRTRQRFAAGEVGVQHSELA